MAILYLMIKKGAEKWVKYVQNVYNDQREDMPQVMHEILTLEVESTIKLMKSGKATGPDDIRIEALMALSEDNTDLITNLCNIIYNSGYIPMEMRKSLFLPIPKKPKAQNCTDFTKSLMSHVTKLLLKIIQIRIKDRIETKRLANCKVASDHEKVQEKEYSTSEQYVNELSKWKRIFIFASLIILRYLTR